MFFMSFYIKIYLGRTNIMSRLLKTEKWRVLKEIFNFTPRNRHFVSPLTPYNVGMHVEYFTKWWSFAMFRFDDSSHQNIDEQKISMIRFFTNIAWGEGEAEITNFTWTNEKTSRKCSDKKSDNESVPSILDTPLVVAWSRVR